jgi:glycosyltransferase involved in cell wall biosynthesis
MKKYKICILTPYSVEQEPRAPRHARYIARQPYVDKVYFVDCIPMGGKRNSNDYDLGSNIVSYSCAYPTRKSGVIKLAFTRLFSRFWKSFYPITSNTCYSPINYRSYLLYKQISKIDADIFFGHNIESLVPIVLRKNKKNIKAIFDCMEFYSDMGDGQTRLDREIISMIENDCLHKCELVLASSQDVADALKEKYTIDNTVAIYNKPPFQNYLRQKKQGGLHLYWRNSTIALSQRGLGDILVAMKSLPGDVYLHVQGRKSFKYEELICRIKTLQLTNRVFIHEPYKPEEAVLCASEYHIGICPEQNTCANQRLTVSNKLFDYMMAGLAVVVSDLPGISSVVKEAKSGLIFRSGNSDSLAEQIMFLYNDRALLKKCSENASLYANTYGNEYFEMKKLLLAIDKVINDNVSA